MHRYRALRGSNLRPSLVSFIVGLIVALVVALAGCPLPPAPPPRCPAGQVLVDGRCAFAWEDACAAASASGCVLASATRCDVDDVGAIPAYDCETCGCGAADACVGTAAGSLCLSADVREGERSGPLIDDGLDDAAYVSLLRLLLSREALTLRQVLRRLQERRAEDPRRSIVVLGGDAAEISRVMPVFFSGSFGLVRTADDCSDVDGGLLPDDQTVLLSAIDGAHEATCLHPGVFGRCEFPSVAGCAVLAGLRPESFVLLGAKTIADVDNALLRHAARAGRDQWLARFDAELGLFAEVFLSAADERFAVVAGSGNLRFVIDADRDDVVFGLLVNNPNPAQLRTFRLMWADASIEQFLTVHDITPSQCSFVVTTAAAAADDDEVDVDCEKNGARISGHVVLLTNDLSDLTLAAP